MDDGRGAQTAPWNIIKMMNDLPHTSNAARWKGGPPYKPGVDRETNVYNLPNQSGNTVENTANCYVVNAPPGKAIIPFAGKA